MKRIKAIIKAILAKILHLFFCCVTRPRNEVLFESYEGHQYSCNPRAVSEKLHELYPDIIITWHITHKIQDYFIPDYVNIVNSRLDFYRSLARARAFVKNTPFTADIPKRKGQCFVQTWHGDRGFKKVLYDSGKKYSNPICDREKVDLCVAGSDFGEKIYRSAFLYQGKVLNQGCPRNDLIIAANDAYRNRVKRSIGVPADCKVLLYAPTFRDNNYAFKSLIDIDRSLKKLEEKFNCKWVCLIRSHVISTITVNDKDKNRCLDVSTYPDMADLLTITDFLITDYSSCAFDYSITLKPLLFAGFDEQDYMANSRLFYERPKEVERLFARSQVELEEKIMEFSTDDYADFCKAMNKFYGVRESGESSKAVSDYLFHEISNQ